MATIVPANAPMIATTIPRVTINFVVFVSEGVDPAVDEGVIEKVVDDSPFPCVLDGGCKVTAGKLPGVGASAGGSITLMPQIVNVADPFEAVCNTERVCGAAVRFPLAYRTLQPLEQFCGADSG